MNPLRYIDVSLRFGELVLLQSFSGTVAPSERVLVEGGNGSGKTSLLRLGLGLLGPTSGEVRLFNDDPLRAGPVTRRRVGAVLAGDGGWWDRLTGAENLAAFAQLWGLESRAVEKARAEWGDWSLLEVALGTPLGQASSGMRQSLRLLRSCLGDPEFLIWDEPWRNLDQEGILAVADYLHRAQGTKALLLAAPSGETRQRANALPWTQVWRLARDSGAIEVERC